MKFVLLIFICSIFNATFAQQTNVQNQKAKEELQKLWNDMQDAAVKKDRKTLESFFADEFLFIHSSGQEDNKERRISSILSIPDYKPAPMPSFDELFVYDNVAVLRAKGVAR